MKTLKYIALAALTLSFAACEKNNDFQGVSDPDAVKINATIGTLQTRVMYGENGTTNFIENDQICVENTLRATKNIATYTTADGMNWTTTDNIVWNGSSKNKFQAYYPVADYSSFDSFTIPEDQATNEKLALADWMTVETEEIDRPEDRELDLNFQHRLVKVTVKLVEWSSEYNNEERDVKDVKMYSKGGVLNATYDDEGVATITATNNDLVEITPLPNASKTEFTVIVTPTKYEATDNLMTFTVNDEDALTVPVGGNATLLGGLEAGKHYIFDLKVGKNAVEIGTVAISEWIEWSIEGGVAEEVIPTPKEDE